MNGDDKKYFEKLLEVHALYLGQKIDSVNFNQNEKYASLEKKVDVVLPKVLEHDNFIKGLRKTAKIVLTSIGTIITGLIVYFLRGLVEGKK